MTIAFNGYAIVSSDGFIADDSGRMPEALCVEADWAYFRAAIGQADLMILGRHTHELSPSQTNRPRLVVSGRVRAVIQENATTWWVNPNEVTPASAVSVVAGSEATVAVAGGTGVYSWVLEEGGYDEFHLSVARKIELGAGRPLLDDIDGLEGAISAIENQGLAVEEKAWLDEKAAVELITFRRQDNNLRDAASND